MSNYLSLLIITDEVIAANNKTDGMGTNVGVLPKIHTSVGDTVTISAVSYKYGLRTILQDRGVLNLYRTVDPVTPGLWYGPPGNKSIAFTLDKITQDKIEEYDDSIFGHLAPEKKEGKNKEDKKKDKTDELKNTVSRSLISITPIVGISRGARIDTHFHQGHTVKSDENYAPFNIERFSSRFMFVVTLDIGTIRKVKKDRASIIITEILRSIQAGVPAGGSQANNQCGLVPAFMAARFHTSLISGLGLPVTYRCGTDIDVNSIKSIYANRGLTDHTFYGSIPGCKTIAEGFDEIIVAA